MPTDKVGDRNFRRLGVNSRQVERRFQVERGDAAVGVDVQNDIFQRVEVDSRDERRLVARRQLEGAVGTQIEFDSGASRSI